MAFCQGDGVVHPNFGVGTIAAIEERAFPGSQQQSFYRVEFFKTTVIWVPVLEQNVLLRPITLKSQLALYRAMLESPPVHLNINARERHRDLEVRAKEGTFQSICELVRDLNAWHGLNSLTNFERILFRQSWDALLQEWIAASGSEQKVALDEINASLLKGKPDRTAQTAASYPKL